MDQPKGFGYVPSMNCPVLDCNVPGAFPSRAKYQRHWEERHVPEVQKWSCPFQSCNTMVRRKSDMKSHIRYLHKEADPVIVSSLLDKCINQIVKAKNYIPPVLYNFTFRRAITHPSTSSSSVHTSAPSVLQPVDVMSVSPPVHVLSVHTPVDVISVNPPDISVPPSTSCEPVMASSSASVEPPFNLPSTSKKITVHEYLLKPQNKLTLTACFLDHDLYIPPILSSRKPANVHHTAWKSD